MSKLCKLWDLIIVSDHRRELKSQGKSLAEINAIIEVDLLILRLQRSAR